MPCVENMIEFYTISFTYGPQSTIDVRSGPGNSTESDLLIEAKSKLYNLVQSVGDRFRDQKRLLAQLPGINIYVWTSSVTYSFRNLQGRFA